MPGQFRKGRETSRLPARRRADLVEFVQEHGHATVGMLVEALDVSGDTVRRDLQYLHEQGVVVRSYGGVVRRDDLARFDRPFLSRMRTNSDAKAAIGALAASLVSDLADSDRERWHHHSCPGPCFEGQEGPDCRDEQSAASREYPSRLLFASYTSSADSAGSSLLRRWDPSSFPTFTEAGRTPFTPTSLSSV